MFRKRIPLNKREVPSQVPQHSDYSSSSDNPHSNDTINNKSLSNSYETSDFSSSDTNVSFRRGLRDGTITNNVDLSPNGDFKSSKRFISNLSFTDSIVENDFEKIHLRNTSIKTSLPKKRPRKGIDLTNTNKPATHKPEIPEKHSQDDNNIIIYDVEPVENGALNDDLELSDGLSHISEDSTFETEGTESNKNNYGYTQSCRLDMSLFELSEVELDFDIDLEISQLFKSIEDELHILNKNLYSSNNQLTQNTEKFPNLDIDRLEMDNDINLYFTILDSSKTLFSLVESKIAELSKTLDKIRINRIEETECLLRMRRWIYCDLLRISGVKNVDYRCGELEDIDEMGKDLSISIGRAFEGRVDTLHQMKQDLVKNSLKHSRKLKSKDLESYLVPAIVDLFTFKLGFNYSLSELSELYDYQVSLEDVKLNVMDDVNDEYKSINTSLDFLRQFKKDYELLKDFDFVQNLKDVFLFYAKVSILTWNPLLDPNLQSLEWYKVAMEFDKTIICSIVDEVLFLLALNCIEYFDIESYEQSSNLALFLKFVLQNSSNTNRSINVDKITSALIKSLQTKVSIVTVSINFEEVFEPSSLISDTVINHTLKFSYLNLITNVLCFSDILSNVTIATIAVDDLFINKLLPLINFDSALDAFLVLYFKRVTAPLSSHFQIKTKNNSIVKLTYSRFSDSGFSSISDSDVFNSLSVPIDGTSYSKLIDS